MKEGRKKREIDSWLSGEKNILVATSAVSLGVDNKNCDFAVHLGASSSISNWIQETGRCGRKGQNSFCITFYDSSYSYKKICYQLEEAMQRKEFVSCKIVSGNTMVQGNNRLMVHFKVIQQRMCYQELICKWVDGNYGKGICGKCSNRTEGFLHYVEWFNIIKNLTIKLNRLDDSRKFCVLTIAKIFCGHRSNLTKRFGRIVKYDGFGILMGIQIQFVIEEIMFLIIEKKLTIHYEYEKVTIEIKSLEFR